MGDVRVDLDRLTNDAWRGFRAALADAIDGLEVGETLLLEHYCCEGGEDCPPHAFVTRQKPYVLIEVASNRIINREQRLTRRGCAHLRSLGFTSATRSEPYYWTTVPATHVDQAASLIVEAFRGPFSVPHPSFLACPDVTWQADSQLPTPDAVPELPQAVQPVNREHLDQLVDRAMSSVVGCLPERDSDGDLPIRAGRAVVFVRSHDRAPVVRIFSLMAVDISDLEAAERETNTLNRQVEGIKFLLCDDTIVATVDLSALPFVADHLRFTVARLVAVVSDNAEFLASRVSGRVFGSNADAQLDPDSDDDDESAPAVDSGIHPVMLCMLQLDAEKPGSVKAKDAAKLCGYDRDLLLELIRWNEEQEIAWREARDEANETQEYEEAEVCEHERAHAERTAKVLRKALRKVVLG